MKVRSLRTRAPGTGNGERRPVSADAAGSRAAFPRVVEEAAGGVIAFARIHEEAYRDLGLRLIDVPAGRSASASR
jgi:hypothetical protein